MSGFSIDWLDLREPADFGARDKNLAAQLVDFLQADTEISPIVVDLGSGTGSTLRALTKLGAHRCVWRLVDHNPALLNEALRRHGQDEIVEDYEADLLDVSSLPLGGASLLSASALFDLVSGQVVDAVVARIKKQGTAFYAALNYDGRTEWTPAHALDKVVLAAFNLDQQRDKGMGPALGPESAAYLKAALEGAGYTVYTGDSPWQLGPDQQALMADLIRGIRSAVSADYGLDQQALDEWENFRLAHVTDGRCLIGHSDVLAFAHI
ncbi:MAG: class I SAM-dependent methyltransferase [Pseudohongiella sp.]|nr:class I SAM-dependent methyltransferase [Pseudohongiella sp.]MDO9520267.1 class I SAM-dependent methyltransferase [Pseudohongiella sp.]MDP2127072.1 class I SAM-dependent methyltransferase [Pseudohongiella sp.]